MDFSFIADLVANFTSSSGISIPATITPVSTAATASVTDPTSIIGIIAAAGAAFGIYKDRQGHAASTTRDNSLADTQIGTVNSLRASDLAAKEDSAGLNALTLKLSEDPNIAKLLNEPTTAMHGIGGMSVADYNKKQSEGWTTANREYYENVPTTPNDFSKDPILQKTSSVQKVTEATHSP